MKFWARFASFVAALVASALPQSASASTTPVYAYSQQHVYALDGTGNRTTVYTFPTALSFPVALAQRPSDGIIFYQNINTTTFAVTLYSFNPATPAVAPVALGTAATIYTPRLAFGPDNVLYATDDALANLYRIDTATGADTLVRTLTGAKTGTTGGDMAFAGDDATLYVVSTDTLYTLSYALGGPQGAAVATFGTGAIATVGTISGVNPAGELSGLAIDARGRLILSDYSAFVFYVIDPSVSPTTATAFGAAYPATENVGDLASVVAPDLQIVKSHAGYFTAQGTTATAGTYTLQVENTGNATTYGQVTVSDTLPAPLTFASASGTGWACAAAGQTVTCTSGAAIAAGTTASPTLAKPIALAVYAPNAPKTFPLPGSVVNTASVSGGNEPALLAGNDTASDTTAIGALTVVKSVNATAAKPGDTLVYTLVFTNANPPGGKALSNISVTDVLPVPTTLVSAACPTGAALPAGLTCTISAPAAGASGTVRWSFAGNLALGASGTLTLTVKLP